MDLQSAKEAGESPMVIAIGAVLRFELLAIVALTTRALCSLVALSVFRCLPSPETKPLLYPWRKIEVEVRAYSTKPSVLAQANFRSS